MRVPAIYDIHGNRNPTSGKWARGGRKLFTFTEQDR